MLETVVKQNNKKIAIKAISYIEDIGKACKQNDFECVKRHADWCLTELKSALYRIKSLYHFSPSFFKYTGRYIKYGYRKKYGALTEA